MPAATRRVAPVSLPVAGDVDVRAPPFVIDRVRMLDPSAVPVALLGNTVASAVAQPDAIMHAIDIILRGCPVGGPPDPTPAVSRRHRPH